MSGTAEGGKKAAAENMRRYGKDFYKNIGRKGGLKSTGGAFRGNSELAREMGRKGGLVKGKRDGMDYDA